MPGNFLSGVQSHKLETTLQVSTWSKGNRSSGPCDLAVARKIFLVNLAVLPDLEAQVLLVLENLARHYRLGANTVRYSSFCWEEIKHPADTVEHNLYSQKLWNPLEL